ncbi:unnamed protein product [Trichogramma brassicae]|uniref:Uncharacterized protein n=1 Tax=Trichogramma brassicae TaxID=86971 RepID=A0A6H5I1M0_9HYME|nr:unnamed protein product [Trichogramma brassicae]
MSSGQGTGTLDNPDKKDVFESPLLSEDDDLTEREATLKRRLRLTEEKLARLQHQLSLANSDSVNVSLHQEVAPTTSAESALQSSTSVADVKNTLINTVTSSKPSTFSFQNVPPLASFNLNPTASPFTFGIPSPSLVTSSSSSNNNWNFNLPPVNSFVFSLAAC